MKKVLLLMLMAIGMMASASGQYVFESQIGCEVSFSQPELDTILFSSIVIDVDDLDDIIDFGFNEKAAAEYVTLIPDSDPIDIIVVEFNGIVSGLYYYSSDSGWWSLLSGDFDHLTSIITSILEVYEWEGLQFLEDD